MLSTGCAEQPDPLPPIPPAIKTVAVYEKLPADLLAPCPKSPWRRGGVQSDVDIVGQWQREQVRADCNAAKLKAIADIQHRPRPETQP